MWRYYLTLILETVAKQAQWLQKNKAKKKLYTNDKTKKANTHKKEGKAIQKIKKKACGQRTVSSWVPSHFFSYPRESNYLSTAARFQSELAKMTYSFVPFSYHTWCTVILLATEPRVVSFPGCHLSLAWPTYVGDHNSPPSWWLHIFHACSWLSLCQLLAALRTLGQLNNHLKVC